MIWIVLAVLAFLVLAAYITSLQDRIQVLESRSAESHRFIFANHKRILHLESLQPPKLMRDVEMRTRSVPGESWML